MAHLYTILVVCVIYVAVMGFMLRYLARRDPQVACGMHAWRWLAESAAYVCDKCGFEAGTS